MAYPQPKVPSSQQLGFGIIFTWQSGLQKAHLIIPKSKLTRILRTAPASLLMRKVMPHFRAHLDPDLLASRVLSPCLFHSLTNKSGISIQLGVTSFAKPRKPCTPLAGTSTLLLDLVPKLLSCFQQMLWRRNGGQDQAGGTTAAVLLPPGAPLIFPPKDKS